MSLSREILKWIQTLDLTYSVKNVKRDFLNGFLIAEMISKYDSSIETHSFSTGINLSSRKDNWSQLKKYFERKSLPISQKMINDVYQDNIPYSALPIVETVYTHLTKREIVSKKPVIQATVELPSYARPTATRLKKDGGRSSYLYSYQNPVKRRRKRKKKTTATLGLTNSRKSRRIRTPSPEKELKRSLPDSQPQANRFVSQFVPIQQKLNGIVENILGSTDFLETSIDGSEDYMESFITQIGRRDSIPKEHVIPVLKGIQELLPLQTDVMLYQPREFWKCTSVLERGLKLPVECYFSEFVEFFLIIGAQLLRKDQKTTIEYFKDFLFEKLCRLLISFPQKRKYFLKIMYAYAPTEPSYHSDIIQLLHTRLLDLHHDQRSFLLCLPVLISFETKFSKELLNTYMCYVLRGLSSSSPSVRVGALSMLCSIAEKGFELVFTHLDQLETLLEDPWWEVQVHLILVSSKMLNFCHPGENEEECKRIYNIIKTVFSSYTNNYVYTIGVCALAPVLTTHKELVNIFTNVMYRLSKEHRSTVLDERFNKQPLFVGNSEYEICYIADKWDHIGVAKSLVKIVLEEQLDDFKTKHFEILSACTSVVKSSTGDSGKGMKKKRGTGREGRAAVNILEWAGIFHELESYLYIGLTDEKNSDISSEIIYTFYKLLGEEALKGIVYLVKTIDLIFNPENGVAELCRENLTKLLIKIYDIGGILEKKLYQVSKTIVEKGLDNTVLSHFVNHVNES